MESVLVFGAHPDDIEFGCGGVIAKETRGGRTAHFVVCSRGESGSNGTPEERTREAEKAAGILGATVEFLELDGDAHLRGRVEHAIRLAGVIRRVRPGIVLAPSVEKNQHPDHGRLGMLVRDACRIARYGSVKELEGAAAHAVGQLFFYAITPGGEPAGAAAGMKVLVDVSDVMGAWVAAMEAHGSQLKTRNYVELQVSRARVNGLCAGVDHAMAVFANDAPVVESLDGLARGARAF